MRNKAISVDQINQLLNYVRDSHGLRSDAALSRFLQLNPTLVCKLRRGYPMSDRVLLTIHEATELSVAQIRNFPAEGMPVTRPVGHTWLRRHASAQADTAD
ncbi:hypothetical protein E4K72_22945 [Oxalobacteraceae bacterium OM1]|nr:hypothetical protein E4K72_22945 [Oxalobacteraceae bacterium OM1]